MCARSVYKTQVTKQLLLSEGSQAPWIPQELRPHKQARQQVLRLHVPREYCFITQALGFGFQQPPPKAIGQVSLAKHARTAASCTIVECERDAVPVFSSLKEAWPQNPYSSRQIAPRYVRHKYEYVFISRLAVLRMCQVRAIVRPQARVRAAAAAAWTCFSTSIRPQTMSPACPWRRRPCCQGWEGDRVSKNR